MVDIFKKQVRSRIMRSVASRGNKTTEMRMFDLFREFRIKGWRRHYKIRGKPDFVFHKQRVAIFVDGCFWHGHNCRNTRPQTNVNFWQAKLRNNILRDKIVTQTLRQRGWHVLRIWECELRAPIVKRTIIKVKRFLERSAIRIIFRQ